MKNTTNENGETFKTSQLKERGELDEVCGRDAEQIRVVFN